MAGIEIRGLSKEFSHDVRALETVNLDVADGEFVVLVGPSGSGKTTLLRLVAGLDEPTAGTISVGGVPLGGVPPHKRNVAMVFQNLALYSHLTVRGNLEFPAGGMRTSKCGIQEKRNEVAKLLGIGHLLDRYPAELSGGEQQRVALGRAIVRQPAALLLDEPLSSLDAPVRRGLRRELKRVQRELGVPTIYVTHDQAEALALGDRIAVLDKGQLQQVGSADEIYRRPVNRFVADFFGTLGMNWIEGEMKREAGQPKFVASAWEVDWPVRGAAGVADGRVLCGFRPEDTHGESPTTLRGEVAAVESVGSSVSVQLSRLGENEGFSTITVTREHQPYPELPKVNDVLTIGINPDRLQWFDAVTGKRV
jgi:multiple sugar transport system ATP-binding protein